MEFDLRLFFSRFLETRFEYDDQQHSFEGPDLSFPSHGNIISASWSTLFLWSPRKNCIAPNIDDQRLLSAEILATDIRINISRSCLDILLPVSLNWTKDQDATACTGGFLKFLVHHCQPSLTLFVTRYPGFPVESTKIHKSRLSCPWSSSENASRWLVNLDRRQVGEIECKMDDSDVSRVTELASVSYIPGNVAFIRK